MKTTTLTLLR